MCRNSGVRESEREFARLVLFFKGSEAYGHLYHTWKELVKFVHGKSVEELAIPHTYPSSGY
jgi:hypothetical protein